MRAHCQRDGGARHDQTMRNLLKQVLHEQRGAHCVVADPACVEGLQQPVICNKRTSAVILLDD